MLLNCRLYRGLSNNVDSRCGAVPRWGGGRTRGQLHHHPQLHPHHHAHTRALPPTGSPTRQGYSSSTYTTCQSTRDGRFAKLKFFINFQISKKQNNLSGHTGTAFDMVRQHMACTLYYNTSIMCCITGLFLIGSGFFLPATSPGSSSYKQ